MGWAHGVDGNGREIGYGIQAPCDEVGCHAQIDRGLAYVCGWDTGSDEGFGCGEFFCYAHLFMGGPRQMCRACQEAWFVEFPEEAYA